MADSKERLAILISGGGTTMAEMIKAVQTDSRLKERIEIAAIISSKSDAGGIAKAIALGIPNRDIVVVDRKDHRGLDGKISEDLFGNHLTEELRAREVTVFTQNGWLPRTPKMVANQWRGYNQHPGDPRDFGQLYGRQVHAAVLEFSDNVNRDIATFAVAHRVTPIIDGGEIVFYESVMVPRPTDLDRVLTGEQAEERFRQRVGELQQSVLPVEHRVQVRLLHRIAGNNVSEVTMPGVVFSGEEGIRDRAKQKAVRLFQNG